MNDRSSDSAAPQSPAPDPSDPVVARRAQFARWCDLGKRAGYTAILVAMVVFVIGFIVDFTALVTNTVIICLALSAVFLIPAIIFGYGIKAAEQEERGESFHY